MSGPVYYPSTQTIRAKCIHCDGALSNFHTRNAFVQFNEVHEIGGKSYQSVFYMLFNCPGCGHGALGVVHCQAPGFTDRAAGATYLEAFYPFATANLALPPSTPADLTLEFREAELCAAAGAYRAASALLRSTLEKTLKANGYIKGNDPTLRDLQKRIDAAAADGIITDVRRKKAHEDIRSLGNDVLHDEWRAVTQEEFDSAHHYTQRILEDFYDDRQTVERILAEKAKARAVQPDNGAIKTDVLTPGALSGETEHPPSQA